MKNTFGNQIKLTIFGESHGEAIGCVLDGIAPGIDVDEREIANALKLRRPADTLNTGRVENDDFKIISGVFNGKTTGTPLCIQIANNDTKSKDYEEMKNVARPSHADYTGFMKYHGYNDPNGGGHFSGRLTAVFSAVGGILIPALLKKGIIIGSHIKSIGGVEDRSFDNVIDDIMSTKGMSRPVLTKEVLAKMESLVDTAKKDGDSLGGVIETAVYGMPAGIGEPWFDTVEGMISKAMFSIPAIKGVEFGDGFGLAKMRGSDANDAMRINNSTEIKNAKSVNDIPTLSDGTNKKNADICHLTNHAGGVDGGITNGEPVIFRCAVKPTPTIAKMQQTINFAEMKDIEISGKGRHDPCIALRVAGVIDSVTALVVADLLATRFGTDWLA